MYTFVGSLVAIGLSGLWAYIVKQPLVFPSLGATAFLIFETPMAEVGTPRNTIIGHTRRCGRRRPVARDLRAARRPERVRLRGDPRARRRDRARGRADRGILRLVRSAHPPAGATTIIVASGLLAKPRQILDILIGVLLLTIAGWCLNRLMGVPAPVVGSATVVGLIRAR